MWSSPIEKGVISLFQAPGMVTRKMYTPARRAKPLHSVAQNLRNPTLTGTKFGPSLAQIWCSKACPYWHITGVPKTF